MSHTLVMFITDDDGESMEPDWHLVQSYGDADRAFCNGHVVGEGESGAMYKSKIVSRGVPCSECRKLLKWAKSIKL